jgi:ATPase subunit of ABC transporter with duplicated ATPase domains
MAKVRLQGVGFGFRDDVPLLSRVDLAFDQGFSAIVGGNGAGKSTLLRLVAGELAPETGLVVVDGRVALCAQEVAVLDPSIVTFAEAGDGPARALRGRLALDARALGRWSTLSPGERKRWQIAAALHGAPEILLLDEPTNHVDVEARALLLSALARFDGIGLVVSHDRDFLDALAHSIVRIDGGALRVWPAPFAVARAAWEAEREAEVEAYDEALGRARARKRALADLRRTHVAAEASRSARARMKNRKDSDARSVGEDFRAARAEARLGRRVAVAREKLERVEIPRKPRGELGAEIFLGFEPAPSPILAVFEGDLGVEGRTLARDLRITIRRDDRVRVTGRNGAGKTTLLSALSRSVRSAKVGLLPQEPSPEEILESVRSVRALEPRARGRVLSLVAALGVDPARLLASARPSPGEARKLALAHMLGTNLHALFLDEPTNHLDLPAIERLEEALSHYPGALVLVTHDDAFARRCATRTIALGTP